ncbi:hypothetical protein, partial [Spirillospora sp. NPDC048819]|uniref:hypothetical protein n=1 Tax=Spirillospora sp. NPDC048819 TaxID=3155268 RepID=UPI00340C67E8
AASLGLDGLQDAPQVLAVLGARVDDDGLVGAGPGTPVASRSILTTRFRIVVTVSVGVVSLRSPGSAVRATSGAGAPPAARTVLRWLG